jgi:hypothetical protein
MSLVSAGTYTQHCEVTQSTKDSHVALQGNNTNSLCAYQFSKCISNHAVTPTKLGHQQAVHTSKAELLVCIYSSACHCTVSVLT